MTPDSWVMTNAKPSVGIAKIITHTVGFPGNARLIAAAPDLLEALKAIRDEAGFDSLSEPASRLYLAQQIARTAIFKAEGR